MLAETMLVRNVPVEDGSVEPASREVNADPVPADVDNHSSPDSELVGDLVAAEEDGPLLDGAPELERAGMLGEALGY